ncbi:HU family DNA-binding protein [Aquicoccus sp.]|uniref:HU family DNA-binding protein n=1 Tax=Aquicoccus sp. TaxID=2055851 RepID=UPI003565B678
MAKSTTTSTKSAGEARPRTVKVSPKSTAKPARAATVATPDPVVVEQSRPEVAAPAMRKKELVDAVVSRSGVKPRYVKPAVEAVLSEIAGAIAEGRGLDLPGLGKVKVQHSKKLSNGDVYAIRNRQPKPAPARPAGSGAEADKEPNDPLAEGAK